MHTDLTETLKGARQTFLDIPAAVMPRAGSVAIFGAVHGTPYPDATNQEGETGPEAVRRAITAACVHLENWDFDFGGPLLNDGALEVIDLGDVVTDPQDAAANRENIERTTRAVLAAGAIPVLIGGDDSVAIPFMRGLGQQGRCMFSDRRPYRLARQHWRRKARLLQHDAPGVGTAVRCIHDAGRHPRRRQRAAGGG